MLTTTIIIIAFASACVVLITMLITKKRALQLPAGGTNLSEKNRELYLENQAILTALPIGIAIYDKDARQEYINETVVKLFGVTDIEAHRAKRICLYDDPILSEELKQRIRNGQEIDTIIEYNLQTVVGSSYFTTDFSHKMYIDGKMRYVKDKQGRVQKYIMIINDITKEKVHDLEMQRSELNLKLALETGDVDVWHYDVQSDRYYAVHGQVVTIEGATMEQVINSLHAKDKNRFIDAVNDLLSGKVKDTSFINHVIDKNGVEQYLKTKIISVCNANGVVDTLIGGQKVITEEYYRQKALEESLIKMHTAIRKGDMAMWNYDCMSRLFDALNDSIIAENTRVSPEAYLRLMHPEDVDMSSNIIRRMNNCEDFEFSFDIRMKLPNMEGWQYTTVDGAPIKDENGNVLRYTGFRRNNTKWVQLNEQIKEQNMHLNMMLRSGFSIPMVLNLETEMVYLTYFDEQKDSNNDGEEQLGASLDSLIAKIHPDDQESTMNMFRRIRDGVVRSDRGECRYDARGKFEKIYELNYAGIDYDKSGKPAKIIGYMQNITERRNNENRIKKQKEFMTDVFDRIPFPVQIKDPEVGGRYVYWNKESTKVFGDGLYKTSKDIMDSDRAQMIEEIDRHVFDTEEPYVGEIKMVSIDGTEFDAIVHKSIIYDGNKKLLLIVQWDVSIYNELKRQSKILSMSLGALQAFTWNYDPVTQIVSYGKEFDAMTPHPDHVNTMVRFAQKIHPEDRDRYIDFMSTFSQQNDGEYSIEYRIDMYGTGVYSWWESRGVMDIVNDKKFIYGMDISIEKHKQTELEILNNAIELNESNRQNELMLNNMDSGLLLLNEDMVVVWENLTRYMPDIPLLCEYRKGEVCYRAVRGFEAPCPDCVVMQSRKSGNMEYRDINYGDIVARLTASPVFDDDHSRIGTVLKVTNVTESRRIHRELEAAKDRAETANIMINKIIDNLPCLLFIKNVDNDFRHVIANKYLCDVLGKSLNEVIGKNDYEIFDSIVEADRCRRDDIRTVESGAIQIIEEETIFLGKRIIWQTTKTVMRAANGDRLIIAISLDVTTKMMAFKELAKAKAHAEQSNKLKSAFLANMSHEIRTPLNAIVGFSELMKDTTDRQEIEAYSDIIRSNNELLLQLISDILDLSKIEAGMIELHPIKFDIVDLFKEVSAMFALRTSDRVTVLCESPYTSCMVELDKNRYMQVITNFMTNALKFTPNGHITLGYRCENNGITAYVVDTGIGIAEDKIGRVFDRFEKLDTFAQGTGLGMAISKAIVDTCHGKIGVESEVGKGSTFWAWIPVEAKIVP